RGGERGLLRPRRPRLPPALAVPRYVRPSTERLRHLAPGGWASPASHSTADARRGGRSNLLYFCPPRPRLPGPAGFGGAGATSWFAFPATHPSRSLPPSAKGRRWVRGLKI